MIDIDIREACDDAAISRWLTTRIVAALDRTPSGIAIAVPGGSTPFPILAELAGALIDWSRIAVWPGDDRMVEESNAASNVGRIRELLEGVGARIVPLTADATPPHFAIAWLGMGTDGHVASLFPNTDPRVDDPARVRTLTPDPLPPEAPYDRITLTIPALLDSDELVFVIRGAEKRAVLDAALAGETDVPVARLLHAATQRVTCFT